MKRFDDVLRILSSILLGILVKDFNVMTTELNKFFAPYQKIGHESSLSFLTVIVLIAVFFRNIHGNARYDDVREKTRCVIWFEQYPMGRFGTFFLAVAALFFGPSLAGQILAYHLTPNDSIWALGPLFLPFLIYAFWDFWLLVSISECRHSGLCLTDVVLKWNKLNAVGCLIFLICFAYTLILESNGVNISPMFICWVFIVIAVIIVGGDYFINHAFYFPSYNQENKQDN